MTPINPICSRHYDVFIRRCRLILRMRPQEDCAQKILQALLQQLQLDGNASLKTEPLGRVIEFSVTVDGEKITGRVF